MPYARALALIKAKRADAMFGTYSAKEEGKSYLLTPNNPIDTESTVAYFKTARVSHWQGMRSLNAMHLAWVRGYDYDDAFPIEPSNITEVTDTAQGLSMLAKDRFDVYLNPRIELLNSLESSSLDKSNYQMRTVMVKHLFMAFSKTAQSEKFASIYDERFPILLANGQIEIFFKNYGRELPFLSE